MPTMSPVDVQGTLKEICFAPGIHWDAESLGQVLGCSVARIGSIPGVIRQCALSAAGVRLYEFEYAFLSTVQVARIIGKSRTAVVRLKRKGRLNPRLGPNNTALFPLPEVVAAITGKSRGSSIWPASLPSMQHLRALLAEHIRLFEHLKNLDLPVAIRDQWEQCIEVRRAAVCMQTR